MDELRGSGGGWTRLAYLNMTDSTENCPSGFKLYQSGGVRACGRSVDASSCTSVQFPFNGISYSQVCGRAVRYQYGTPDADNAGRYQGESYGSIIDPITIISILSMLMVLVLHMGLPVSIFGH